MKLRIYIRAGKGRNGNKVAVGVSANYNPLVEQRRGLEYVIPTAMFAIEVEVPEEALRHPEQVAASVRLAVGQVLVEPPEEIKS